MKLRSHKEFKQREDYLKQKLQLNQSQVELKLKELQFRYLGKGFNFLKKIFTSRKQ
jgi:hypothetical protein